MFLTRLRRQSTTVGGRSRFASTRASVSRGSGPRSSSRNRPSRLAGVREAAEQTRAEAMSGSHLRVHVLRCRFGVPLATCRCDIGPVFLREAGLSFILSLHWPQSRGQASRERNSETATTMFGPQVFNRTLSPILLSKRTARVARFRERRGV